MTDFPAVQAASETEVITVRYWAGARAAAGTAEDVLAVDGDLTLADVVARVLELHPDDRMARTVDAHCDALLAERDSIRGPVGPDEASDRDEPADYLGTADRFVDQVLRRAGKEVTE